MPPTSSFQPALALHGGAGTLQRGDMSAEMEQTYRAALRRIAEAGVAVLADGGSALDAVTETVRLLEECELFNAGKGSVYTADARHEMDASVMDGPSRRAGAVAGISRVRNPVLAARAVMEHSGHVMLIGSAAEVFAQHQGLELVAPEWFGTPQRLRQLQRAREQAGVPLLDHDAQHLEASMATAAQPPIDESTKMGTVGAVALDARGQLAAATSTGGMTMKRAGRVGDSPILGAGCWADAAVAVSCTGTGEAFMRSAAAHELSALMRLKGLSLAQAAEQVLWQELPSVQGQGGLIAVDAGGELLLGFNTEGMYRASGRVGEPVQVGVYKDE
ncbi:isoaspartyl peptidase/L-asparaginase [Pelomonas sp. CA6]|uniref:isoaspartyl peptidase/L-asparaginase family protein n=1 Tax=Pelomonas sp. CA6 TaxID=2907999 RepID=UPI001F4BED6E|nr:isoaspartyl peptidase/L-asparaginase [Pelomonas sp. CA6]MCH7345037.1 isoaspartyl peptidase/L-asparaginase [Pelomonas sp. CA6]